MFNFPDISKLDPLELLGAIQDAKEYWGFLWHLKKLWSGFGNRSLSLISIYRPFQVEKSNVHLLNEIYDLSEVKMETIVDQLKLVDAWLASAFAAGSPNSTLGTQSIDGEEFDLSKD